MSGKSLPALLVRQLGLVVFFFLTATLSSAQTAVKTPEALKIDSRAPTTSRVTETGVANTATASDTTAAVRPDNSEANLKDPSPEPVKSGSTAGPEPAPTPCNRNISAEVVALPHPIMLNRLGASVPDGLVFALKGDTLGSGANARLKPDKRPRPIVLRANVGDCLTITFTNSIPETNFGTTKVS